jgi:hypothetical protein
MTSDDRKNEVARFLFDALPDAFYIKISDKIVVEFRDESGISLDELAAISDGLNTDSLCVKPSDRFCKRDGVPHKSAGMILEIRDWTFMEEAGD